MADVEVEALAAKQAITEVLYRYCRGLDRMDRYMANAVWHEGGTADYGPMFNGTGRGFIDWVWGTHETMDRHSHQIANILIDVDDDRATSESYVTVRLQQTNEEGVTVITTGGRYLDRWSRRGGVWAIDSRQYVHEFEQRDTTAAASVPEALTTSRRTAEDPSIAMFAGTAYQS